MRRTFAIAAAVLTLLAVSLNAGSDQIAEIAARPLTAGPAAAETPPNTIALFKNSDCRRDIGVIELESFPAGRFHALPDAAKDQLSSLRWNVEHGVVVVFYKNGVSSKNKGSQFTIFGNGQHLDLDDAGVNDELSSWAWYRVY